MIEICLNPANETLGSELFDPSASAADAAAAPPAAAADKRFASALPLLSADDRLRLPVAYSYCAVHYTTGPERYILSYPYL